MTERLLWLDLETTGLDPSAGSILQVACVTTDLDGSNPSEPFEAVVRHCPASVAELRSSVVPYVDDMHATTGLWDRLPGGVSLSSIEAELVEMIEEFGSVQLAGNSVHFDYGWIAQHLPRVHSRIGHRLIDVTCLSVTLERAGHDMAVEFVGDKHNAIDDILHAVKQYQRVWEVIAR